MAEPLSIAASIITVLELSVHVIKYIGGVREARSDKDKLLQEISASNDLLREIKALAPSIRQHNAEDQWLVSVATMCSAEGGPLQTYKTALEALQAKLKPATGIMRVGSILKWPFDKEDVRILIDTIERQKRSFGLAMQMDTLNVTLSVHTGIKEAVAISTANQVDIKTTQKDAKAILQINREDIENKVCDWLSTYPYTKKHDNTCLRRMENSGEWLLASDEYKTWRDGPASESKMLWCAGIPGAGKTVITSIIIEDLVSTFQQEEAMVAYFYCEEKQKLTHSALTIIACLVKQLAVAKASLPTTLVEMYNKKRKFNQSLLLKDFDLVAPLLCKDDPIVPMFIVIDALDECEVPKERKALLKFLTALQPFVKILVTSRMNILDIENSMKTATQIKIEASSSDIRRYVNEQIDESDEFESLFEERTDEYNELKEYVATKIVESAKGMFLLPALQIRSILNKESITEVRKATEHLPTDLEVFYQETLGRIKNAGRSELALRTLTWICLAKRSLTSDELRHALAIRSGQTVFNKEDLTTINFITTACLGLLIHDKENCEVRLVHLSLKEYLKEQRDELFPLGDFAIAESCLAYLSLDKFKNGRCLSVEDYGSEEADYPFLYYAAQYWGEHWQAAGDPLEQTEALNFLRNSELVNHAAQFGYWTLEPIKARLGLFDSSPRNWEGLHLAAIFGLKRTAEYMLNDDAHVSTKNEWGISPLHCACQYGHSDVVEVLLDWKADIDSLMLRNIPYVSDIYEKSYPWMKIGLTTPLHIAANYGHESVARLLLDRGANIHLLTTDGDTALIIAANNSHTGLPKLFIERGQNVSASCTMQTWISESGDPTIELVSGYTALHAAASSGNKHLVELLLQAGADVDAACTDGITPLLKSTIENSPASALVLLDHDADITVLDKKGLGALHYAAWNAMDAVVSKILEKGIDVNQTYKDATPLGLAAICGNLPTCQLLLDLGASLKTKDCDNWTTLHYLCAATLDTEPTDVTRFLIEKGADVNAVSDNGITPIFFVASQSWPSVISTLLENGANVNSQTRLGVTPIHEAIGSNDELTIKELLAHGANLSAEFQSEDDFTCTPLMWAITKRLPNIARMIIDADHSTVSLRNKYGNFPFFIAAGQNQIEIMDYICSLEKIDIEEQSMAGLTPLMFAFRNCHPESAEHLIEKGCDIHTIDNNGNSIIHTAAIYGDETLISLALGLGLDINARDCWENTPLMMAAANNCPEAVELLLKHDADTTLENIYGQTALARGCYSNALAAVSILLEKNVALSTDGNRNSDFHYCALAADSDCMGALIGAKKGQDLNIRNIKSNTPLHLLFKASGSATNAKIKLLCDAGCDVNVRNDEDETPLHMAANEGLETAIWFLLEKGCDASLKNTTGETALDKIQALKESTTLQQDAATEDSIDLGSKGGGVGTEKPVDKLRRVVKSFKSGRTAFTLASTSQLKKLPEDPIEKLRQISKRFKPAPDAIDKADVTGGSVNNQQPPPDGTPEHQMRKLRRIERMLIKATSKDESPHSTYDGLSLISAIEENRHVNLKAAIRAGFDINFQDSDKTTIVYAAACTGRLSLVQQCLNLGADPSLANIHGNTPLHVAVREGELAIARELLLHAKVDVNAINKQGNSPLHISPYARKNVTDIIRLLLDSNARIDGQNSEGKTVLMLVITQISDEKLRLELVKSLLEKEADVNLQDSAGNPALQIATLGDSEGVIRQLLAWKSLDINIKNKRGSTLFHNACRNSVFHIFIEFAAKGGDFDAINNFGYTSLHFAAYNPNLTVFKHVLQETKYDISTLLPNCGATALHFACVTGNYQVASFLLDRGASADTKVLPHEAYDSSDAAYFGDHKLAAGSTPLMAVAICGNGRDGTCVAMLLKRHNADINAHNDAGLTALMYAAQMADSEWQLNWLLEQGAEVNVKDSEGKTALHHTIHSNGVWPLRRLLKAKADVSATDANGKTPLDLVEEVLAIPRPKTKANDHFMRAQTMGVLKRFLVEEAEKQKPA